MYTGTNSAAPASSPAAQAGGQALSTAANLAAPGIAAIAGEVIGRLFTKRQNFANASTEIHNWFRNHASQAFLDWMKQNHPNEFGTLDQVKGLHYAFLLNDPRFQHINFAASVPHQIGNNWGATAKFFRDVLGVDLDASDAALKQSDPNWTANNPRADVYKGVWDGVHANIYHGPQIKRVAPSPIVSQVLQEAKNNVDNGTASPSEQRAIDLIGKNAGGFDLGTVVAVIMLALLAWVIFRNN